MDNFVPVPAQVVNLMKIKKEKLKTITRVLAWNTLLKEKNVTKCGANVSGETIVYDQYFKLN